MPSISLRLASGAVLLLALASVSAQAAVYRWVDENGKVHYTDRAVSESMPVNINTGQPKGAKALPPDAAVPGAPPAPDLSRLTPEQFAQRQKECDGKRKQLESYKNAARIVETDSLGREHEFSEEEKQQLVKKTETAIATDCTGVPPLPVAADGG